MRGVLLSVAFAVALVLSGCASKPSSETSDSGTDAASDGSGTSSGSGTGGSGPSGSATSANVVAGSTSNRAPAITAFRTNLTAANVTTGAAPLKVTFTFNATDADKDNLTYTLTFGVAKANVTGKLGKLGGNATYTYTTAGNYTAKLVVSDGKVAVNRTVKIAVTAVTAAPLAEVQTLECWILVGLPLPVRVLGASAPVVGAMPGIGGCLTAALAQDAILTSVSYGAECFTDPESAIGQAFEEGQTFNIYCDESVMDTDVSMTFSA